MFLGAIFGLGKDRTRLGKWLDKKGIKQEWLAQKSGLNKSTIRLVCNHEDHMPSGATMQKIIKALREIDPKVKASNFWDI